MNIKPNGHLDRSLAEWTADVYTWAKAKGIEINDLEFIKGDQSQQITAVVEENLRLMELL